MMRLNITHRTIFVGVTLAALFGTLTAMIQRVAAISPNWLVGAIQRAAIVLLLPGLIGSMAIGGNVHAFSLPAACAINMLVYFGVGFLLEKLLGRTTNGSL